MNGSYPLFSEGPPEGIRFQFDHSRARGHDFLAQASVVDRSHAPRGNASQDAPRPASFIPTLDIDQPFHPCIVTRTGIPPVFCQIHIAAFNRIVVDVIELLSHHRLAVHQLGM